MAKEIQKNSKRGVKNESRPTDIKICQKASNIKVWNWYMNTHTNRKEIPQKTCMHMEI